MSSDLDKPNDSNMKESQSVGKYLMFIIAGMLTILIVIFIFNILPSGSLLAGKEKMDSMSSSYIDSMQSSMVDEPIREKARQAGCNLKPTEIQHPTKMSVVKDERTLDMVSLARDASDAAGAPPIEDAYTVGWYVEGPKIGSRQGKAVLTSHTYFRGTAFGNELNDGLWSPGDIIKISDASGNNACYSYKNSHHLMEADYDPESSILYDEEGMPQFALIVCSDWDEYGNPLGRIIYYADLVAE